MQQAIANLRRQCGLGLFSDRLERRRLVDGEIRQHLAVHRDARLGKAVDKDAVGHAERTHRGVEALNPERPEGALLALAVAEGVLRGLFDGGLGGADGVLAAAVKNLCSLVDFLLFCAWGFPPRLPGAMTGLLQMGIGDGSPRGRGSARWDRERDQACGKKYF